ncbi:hypothetical protein HMPREF3213_02211 [Heyndrickxia coagulans]|uniref:Uncharacterized protein n=1 Tax=Heyndrickxia coagulans TaxID=1398 RepID=A0A133KMA2_HEYCO|nr:hypothetical protein HMPREF3213_02211 [Heyndrickxia coagulans]
MKRGSSRIGANWLKNPRNKANDFKQQLIFIRVFRVMQDHHFFPCYVKVRVFKKYGREAYV